LHRYSAVEADEEGVMCVALATASDNTNTNHPGGAGAAAAGGRGARPLLVTGGLDGHVRVWDCSSGAGVMAWKAHGDWIRSLAMHDDRVATAGRDGRVRTWQWPRERASRRRGRRGTAVEATDEGSLVFGHWSNAREFGDVRVVRDAIELEMLEEEDGWAGVGRGGVDSAAEEGSEGSEGSEKEEEKEDAGGAHNLHKLRGAPAHARAHSQTRRRRRCVVRRTFDVAGLYKSNPLDPIRSLQPPGFNP
jgi:hypothetical protein